ncbi:MAG: hypothetical protein KF812_02360 [Fimbriimonadaceae bacterium]|nr:hypothetical protein [Fimbriimonadaceae bacterium]
MSKAVVRGVAVQSGFMQGLAPIDPLLKAGLAQHVSGKVKTQLQEIREKAAEEGQSEGFSEGFAAGQTEGFESGFARGKREARLQYDEQNAVLIEETTIQLQALVEQAQAAFDQWRESHENQLADLAIAIAKRAIADELHVTRESVMEITREALQSVIGSGTVQIRVNPVDTGLLDARIKELQDAAGRHRHLEIVSDPTVESGCRLIMDAGVVDSTIDSYLDRIEDSLGDAA